MILSRKNGYVQRRHLIPDVRVVLNKITVPTTPQRRSSHSESEDESISERTERMKELRIILHRIPLSSDSSNIVRSIEGNSNLCSKKNVLKETVKGSNCKNENEPSVKEDSSDDYSTEDENSVMPIVGNSKKRKHEKNLSPLNKFSKMRKIDFKRNISPKMLAEDRTRSAYKPVFRDLRVVLHRIPVKCQKGALTDEENTNVKEVNEDCKKEIVLVEDYSQECQKETLTNEENTNAKEVNEDYKNEIVLVKDYSQDPQSEKEEEIKVTLMESELLNEDSKETSSLDLPESKPSSEEAKGIQECVTDPSSTVSQAELENSE